MSDEDDDDDRRASERSPVLTLIQYTPQALQERPQIIRTLDLSERGAKVELDAALPLASSISFQVQLGDELLSGEARVVHLLLGSGGRIEAGINFSDLTKDDRRKIRTYLDSQDAAGA